MKQVWLFNLRTVDKVFYRINICKCWYNSTSQKRFTNEEKADANLTGKKIATINPPTPNLKDKNGLTAKKNLRNLINKK